MAIRGYGAALYHGGMAARGHWIIMGDADDSHDFSRLDRFVSALEGGAELVMGNRFAGGFRPGAMPRKNRYPGNPLLSAMGRLFFRSPARDFHCGLRGMTRAAFERMNLRTTGMECASEMVIKATLLRLRVVEVATTLDKDGRNCPPHLRPWRDGWRHVRFMLLYCPRWLFLYPGVVMVTAGAAGMIAVLWLSGDGRLNISGLLLSSAAILLGFQAVTLTFCARIYAFMEGLLPEEPRLEVLFQRLTLEVGLPAGVAVFLVGAVLGVAAVQGWWRPAGLQPTWLLGLTALTGVCLGGQLVLTSFLFSFFGLRRR